MAIQMGSSGSGMGGMYSGASGPSETDGETFDEGTEYDDYDTPWDYQETLSSLTKNVKNYVLQPLVIGAAAAFGMSLGYAIFDATTSLFSGRRGPTKPR